MNKRNFGPFGSFLTTDITVPVGVHRSQVIRQWKEYKKTARLPHPWGQALSLLKQIEQVQSRLGDLRWNFRKVRDVLGLEVADFATLLLWPKSTIEHYERPSNKYRISPVQGFVLRCLTTDNLRSQSLSVLVDYLATYGNEQQRRHVPFYQNVLLGTRVLKASTTLVL